MCIVFRAFCLYISLCERPCMLFLIRSNCFFYYYFFMTFEIFNKIYHSVLCVLCVLCVFFCFGCVVCLCLGFFVVFTHVF